MDEKVNKTFLRTYVPENLDCKRFYFSFAYDFVFYITRRKSKKEKQSHLSTPNLKLSSNKF